MTDSPNTPGGSTPVPPPAVPLAPSPAAPPPPPVPEGPGAPDGRRRHHRGGVGIGIVLVVLGGVLLAGQFLPTVSFWALWPLIIVAVGAVQALTPGDEGWGVNRFFDGLVTVAFGLVLLGCSLGYLPWSIWWRILWLWPVLLISAGIGLIGRAVGQRWLGAIGSVLVILALGWAAATAYQQSPIPNTVPFVSGPTKTLAFSQPVNGATKASLAMSVGAATVKLGPGSDLVKVDAASPFGQPTASVTDAGGVPQVKIGMEQSGVILGPSNGNSFVNVAIAPEVAWDAKVESGATDMTLDFSQIRLAKLDVSTGASDTKITLGPSQAVEGAPSGGVVTFSSGAASVTLRVPSYAQVRVHMDSALVGTQLTGLVSSAGGTYETPGFDATKPYWDVTIKSAVGSMQLVRY